LKDIPSKPFKMPPGMKLVRMKEMTGQMAKGGGAGIIYEALKENQSLHGRVASDSSEKSISYESRSLERYEPTAQPSHEPAPAPLTGTGGLY
jgi:membrane carboxypeptidase/penicillin-binding protein